MSLRATRGRVWRESAKLIAALASRDALGHAGSEQTQGGRMEQLRSVMRRVRFDEIEPDIHGGIEKRSVSVDGLTATRVSYRPGARWSIDMAPDAGVATCPLPRVAVMTEGTLRVHMDDGEQEDFTAGDLMLLPAGHDTWPVSDHGGAFAEVSHGTTEHYPT